MVVFNLIHHYILDLKVIYYENKWSNLFSPKNKLKFKIFYTINISFQEYLKSSEVVRYATRTILNFKKVAKERVESAKSQNEFLKSEYERIKRVTEKMRNDYYKELTTIRNFVSLFCLQYIFLSD